VNVALNFVLIPRYLATGAGIATIITEIIVVAILAYAVHDLPIMPLPWRSIAVITASGCLLFAALFATSAIVPWPVAVVPSLVAVLFGLIVEVGVLTFLCPRLVAGRYPVMKGRMFWAWIFRLHHRQP